MSYDVTFRPDVRVRACAASGLLLAFAPDAGAAGAAEFCVSCLTPNAHYVCAFENVPAESQDPRLKLLCITELAGKGGHASCSVDRLQKTPCQGERKVLPTPDGLGVAEPVEPPSGGDAPAEAEDKSKAAPQTPAADPPAGSPAAAEAPETAPAGSAPARGADSGAGEEPADTNGTALPAPAAKSTGKTAGESALEKAGSAVGQAAKKTWDCISTFFGSC